MDKDLAHFFKVAGVEPESVLADELALLQKTVAEAKSTMVDLPDGSQMSRWDYLQTIVYPFVGQSK